MQTNLFEIEDTEESISTRIKQASIKLQIKELIEKGFIYYARPIARERAKIFRSMGILCKSINKSQIKLLP